MFGRKYWIGLIVFLLAIVGVSLYYLQTRPPKDPVVIIKPVEPLPKSEVKAPVGDTMQGGHVHADGTFHAAPHAPVEVSEAEVSADGQRVPDVQAAPANTQVDAATLESAARRLKDPDVFKAWREWSKEARELRRKHIQAAGESVALLPTTEEEFERIKNDPEWQRRRSEALHKTAEIYTRMKAHEKENPLLQ
ncbi:hypothetical protein C6503_07985 [Candidatus Poribacteria bacterium]|nr:MAG: hypothetical protein C6503_07985 [Candidatus Poribacteria bacterium]